MEAFRESKCQEFLSERFSLSGEIVCSVIGKPIFVCACACVRVCVCIRPASCNVCDQHMFVCAGLFFPFNVALCCVGVSRCSFEPIMQLPDCMSEDMATLP
jgi:hypothetical protein